MLKIIDFLLWSPHISRYEISKTTGISPQALQRYVSGEADIENMTLKNGLKLKKFYEEWIKKMKNKYGSVEYEGKEYVCLDYPVLDHAQGIDGINANHYKVDAVDTEGNQYIIYWNPVDGWEEMDDSMDHCDWENPDYVELIKW